MYIYKEYNLQPNKLLRLKHNHSSQRFYYNFRINQNQKVSNLLPQIWFVKQIKVLKYLLKHNKANQNSSLHTKMSLKF